MSACLKELEETEAAERMTDEELREHYRHKHQEPRARFLTENEYFADQYSCPGRLFR